MKQFLLGALCMFMFVLFIVIQLNIDDDVHLTKELYNFNWLRNSNYLTLFVKPEVDTEIYLPRNINSTKERDSIACFVLSSPKNFDARNAIRQTWGTVMKPLFVIARSDNETMRLVISEAKLFNDIIVEDFQDSYVNLTIKTAFAMKHFLRHFSNSTYFFKIDDDVYLNVENLKKMLEDDNIPKDAIIGRKVTDLRPHREKGDKMYVPYWLYEEDAFPPFHDGPAYLIPGNWQSPTQLAEFNQKIFRFRLHDPKHLRDINDHSVLHNRRRFLLGRSCRKNAEYNFVQQQTFQNVPSDVHISMLPQVT